MPINGLGLPCLQVLLAQRSFLTDHTITRAFGTLCCLSVVCEVFIVDRVTVSIKG